MTKAEHREAKTSAFTLWSYGAHFLGAAQRLGTDQLPALYLACHATELALKSHLRAHGYSVKKLASPEIGHQIAVALSLSLQTGMKRPPKRVQSVLAFADAVHQNHDYRYPYAGVRPLPIWCFVLAAGWALREAAPAVARSSPSIGVDVMRTRARAAIAWAQARSPTAQQRLSQRKLQAALTAFNARRQASVIRSDRGDQ
jgi:hypothetical protein